MWANATKPEKAQSVPLVPARATALLPSLWIHHTTVTVIWIWQRAEESLQVMKTLSVVQHNRKYGTFFCPLDNLYVFFLLASHVTYIAHDTCIS